MILLVQWYGLQHVFVGRRGAIVRALCSILRRDMGNVCFGKRTGLLVVRVCSSYLPTYLACREFEIQVEERGLCSRSHPLKLLVVGNYCWL